MNENFTIKPKYRLKLGNTYFDKGFFNLGISVEKYLTYDEGPIKIFVGEQKIEIDGRITRNANSNGSPRIYGGAELRDWFQENKRRGHFVQVIIVGPKEVWIK